MAWIDDTYVQIQPRYNEETENVRIIQQTAPQQPTTIFQHIPSAVYPSPLLRRGHVKEDLVELMIIQNAQMHQVIMNNMTMSALSSFGYWPTPPAPQPDRHPVTVEEKEPEVYHHYYQPAQFCYCPAWIAPPQPPPGVMHQDHSDHQEVNFTPLRDRRAVPMQQPPPADVFRTWGSEIPLAAAEHNESAEGKA